jgi:hypothetical protein
MKKKTILNITGNKTDIIKYLDKPASYQKLTYRDKYFYYSEIDKYEDKDKICIADATYKVKMGSNGAYRSKIINAGLTFNKKGKSSSRLKFWKRDRNQFNENIFEYLLKDLNLFLNYKEKIKSNVKFEPTQGLSSMIASGKITSALEFFEYYIKYSLRGYNVSINSAKSLINFYKYFDKYIGNTLLRTALKPDDFIKNVDNRINNKHNLNLTINNSFLEQVEALGLKLDWSSFFTDIRKEEQSIIINTINKKYKTLIELSKVWEKGHSINDIKDLPF